MLGIAFVAVVAVALAYVARRSHHPRGIGAFKNRPEGASPVVFGDAGGMPDNDESREDAESGDGSADSTSGDDGGAGGDGGGSDGGGGDGGGGRGGE